MVFTCVMPFTVYVIVALLASVKSSAMVATTVAINGTGLYGTSPQYLPKGTSLANYTQAQRDVIAEKLNNRLRECLGWKTPNEVWAEMIMKALY